MQRGCFKGGARSEILDETLMLLKYLAHKTKRQRGIRPCSCPCQVPFSSADS